MESSTKISVQNEDDEEDLEALRLAALMSLKKKANNASRSQSFTPQLPDNSKENSYCDNKNTSWNHTNKRGRFFPHRNSKNGHFPSRIRSSNLIPITPVDPQQPRIPKNENSCSSPKLILPQDRYSGKEPTEEKSNETDKFNRYNNSDDSDDESDEEKEKIISEDENVGELKKSDSLEDLMRELDNEILGISKPKEETAVKVKLKKKSKPSTTKETVDDNPVSDANTETNTSVEPITSPEAPYEDTNKEEEKDSEPASKKIRKSPVNRRPFHQRRKHNYKNKAFMANPPFVPPLPFAQPPQMMSSVPYNPHFGPPGVIVPAQDIPYFDRPISPLSIDTTALTVQTLAPLSPRSAAFVLENRAIIEKRKRSPRKSYSRSPSPRCRSPSPRKRSRSPKRRSASPKKWSLSPKRRSLSPKRRSPSPKRRSLSPKRRSISPRHRPLMPRRRSCSPNRSVSPKRNAKHPDKTRNRPPIKDRLGVKSQSTVEAKKEQVEEPMKEEKPVDPVLEARKKKFETNEIKIKEGIIRLKPKQEISEEKPLEKPTSEIKTTDDIIDEDKLLDDDELDIDPKSADIFSDEESGSENEGRFKEKQENMTKPPVLSFSKIFNGSKRQLKETSLTDNKGKSKIGGLRGRMEKRTNTDKLKVDQKGSSKPKDNVRNKIVVKSDRHPKFFDRKIEIKIKNPSKYEEEKPTKSKEEERNIEENKPDARKVEVTSHSDDETEIVIENDSEPEETPNKNEGDLRAQLSKKRAGKLQKLIPCEEVQSRLLQNALQSAVFKKPKRTKKVDVLSKSEGKLPIHMRLGIPSQLEVLPERKSKRKSRKRKNKDEKEQV